MQTLHISASRQHLCYFFPISPFMNLNGSFQLRILRWRITHLLLGPMTLLTFLHIPLSRNIRGGHIVRMTEMFFLTHLRIAFIKSILVEIPMHTCIVQNRVLDLRNVRIELRFLLHGELLLAWTSWFQFSLMKVRKFDIKVKIIFRTLIWSF